MESCGVLDSWRVPTKLKTSRIVETKWIHSSAHKSKKEGFNFEWKTRRKVMFGWITRRGLKYYDSYPICRGEKRGQRQTDMDNCIGSTEKKKAKEANVVVSFWTWVCFVSECFREREKKKREERERERGATCWVGGQVKTVQYPHFDTTLPSPLLSCLCFALSFYHFSHPLIDPSSFSLWVWGPPPKIKAKKGYFFHWMPISSLSFNYAKFIITLVIFSILLFFRIWLLTF